MAEGGHDDSGHDEGSLSDDSDDDESDSISLDSSSDDEPKTDKYLLLRDHTGKLTIREVVDILERLRNWISDVQMMERDFAPNPEGAGVIDWKIKAKTSGTRMKDMGFTYDKNYFVLQEHPDYGEAKEKAKTQRLKVKFAYCREKTKSV